MGNVDGPLVWEDLTVEVPSFGGTTRSTVKRLLNGLNGYAQPGRIMALVGPSGSGKTTFLDSLAGRLSPKGQVSGQITLNGRSLDNRDVSYVPQEDCFLGTLTVKETIEYSAHLRLPSTNTKREIDELVKDIIIEMGLEDCADSTIGNWHLRGISNGEKKRLSISLELLTQRYVLLLDEPTTGLDSAAAFFVIKALRKVANDGRIIALSIHQPSSEVFYQFDDLMLLSGGEAIFFGETNSALQFFAEAGFPCPTRKNPCDHYLQCINSDFDAIKAALGINGSSNESDPLSNRTTAEIRGILIEKYKLSEYSRQAKKNISSTTFQGTELVPRSTRAGRASRWKQLWTLTRRSFTNMNRDIGYYWLRIAFYISLAITLGTLYFKNGTTYQSIMARETCDKFIFGFMICLSCGGIPCFTEELKVFRQENSNAKYGEALYVLSNFISSFPFVTATSIITTTIIYYMVKFQHGFSFYAFLLINLFNSIFIMEGCMMAAAALIPHVLMATGLAVAYNGIMIISSPYLRPLPELPKVFWRYPMSYLSFTTWSIEGQYKNDLLGAEFEPLVPGDPKLTGEMIIQSLLGNQAHHSKWWDLAVVTFMSFAYRLMFYQIIKYKGRASSILSKLPIRHIQKIPAKKLPSKWQEHQIITSRRHQPLHSLSSQEGLRSPLP
ncbi:hypothetical protein Dimus_029715 [Dionaea muscipula]